MQHKSQGFERLCLAFGYSIKGLKATFRTEAAFRQELLLAVILIPLAFYVGDNSLQRGLLVASVILLLIVELLNTAIENAVDRFGGEQHELSGAAKDAGSAAVLLALLLVAVVWLAVWLA